MTPPQELAGSIIEAVCVPMARILKGPDSGSVR